MQSRHQSGRSPRLTRRNAIRQSAYVPRPASLTQFSAPQPGQTDADGSSPAGDSDVEEGDELGAAEEAGEVEETGAGTALSEASASIASPVVKRRITNWRRLELVGAGSFGRVYKAVSEDGFVFAVKEASLIGPESYKKQSASQLQQEILLLSQLEHENIIQYFGAKKEETLLSIFLEFVSEGSLVAAYEKRQLEESTISAYTRQILSGLAYLHHHNVMHRDIKCANILLDPSGTVKVGDFGLAKQIKVWKQKRSCAGSVYWMAPEVIRETHMGVLLTSGASGAQSWRCSYKDLLILTTIGLEALENILQYQLSTKLVVVSSLRSRAHCRRLPASSYTSASG
ncbi:unnamed protein product [Urochloa humidicola]